MIDCWLASKKQIHSGRRKNDFELFGFDFLIDEDFRVWLIEVNDNPYLGIPNDYIRKMLPMIINDLFELTLDPIYKPENKKVEPNEFELLFCKAGSHLSKDGASFNAR